MHHKATRATDVGNGSHLAGGSGSREAVLTGLFVLLAFLEEGLRDFNGLYKNLTKFEFFSDGETDLGGRDPIERTQGSATKAGWPERRTWLREPWVLTLEGETKKENIANTVH